MSLRAAAGSAAELGRLEVAVLAVVTVAAWEAGKEQHPTDRTNFSVAENLLWAAKDTRPTYPHLPSHS